VRIRRLRVKKGIVQAQLAALGRRWQSDACMSKYPVFSPTPRGSETTDNGDPLMRCDQCNKTFYRSEAQSWLCPRCESCSNWSPVLEAAPTCE
jgi:hypothetical protein